MTTFPSFPIPWVVGPAIAGFLFVFLRILYRLTFHPLAKFPGPKLAAVTNLYGASYDLFSDVSYVKKLPELHDRYGPIIRAWPDQLHIHDMDAYNQIYKTGTKFDKYPAFYTNPIANGSMFTIPDLKRAKARKDMYQSSFSKAAIQRVESLIQGQVTKFLDIMKEAASDHKVLDLTLGYRCLTADVIMNYCYQKPMGALDAPDFQFPLMLAWQDFLPFSLWPVYFPATVNSIFDFMMTLPSAVIKKSMPPIAAANAILSSCRQQILYLKNRSKASHGSLPTIFDTALNPDPSKGQYTPSDHDLTADAVLMFGAGTDTTANTLLIATWHILSNTRVLGNLKNELREALPGKEDMLNWADLENLPYLRAVVKESLRFSYGAPGRLPRVVPASGATFCGQVIPPKTIICHSNYVYHHDESLFPNAANFSPERWLDDNSQELDKHMLSFSRGSRSCLGMNLAYSELYLTLAHLFRRFDLSLHQTTAADMVWIDCLVPIQKGHLKVLVREAEQ